MLPPPEIGANTVTEVVAVVNERVKKKKAKKDETSPPPVPTGPPPILPPQPGDDALIAGGSALFTDLCAMTVKRFHLSEPWVAIVISLFVLQSALTPILASVFYLILSGVFGSAKSKLLRYIAKLTGALRYENVSISAMAREMTYGRCVTLDEADADRGKENNEMRDALIRGGYDSDSEPYTRYDAQGKKVDRVPTFGPRAIGIRGGKDAATYSRSFPIETSRGPAGHAGFVLVLMNRRLGPEVRALAERVAAWGGAVCRAYPKENVIALEESPEMERAVEASVAVFGANRETELMINANVVAIVAGIQVQDALKTVSTRQEALLAASQDSDLEELAEILLDNPAVQATLEGVSVVRYKQSDLKKALNFAKRTRGEKAVGDEQFARLRRDLGIIDPWTAKGGNAFFWNVPLVWLAALRPPKDEGGAVPMATKPTMATMSRSAVAPLDGSQGSQGSHPTLKQDTPETTGIWRYDILGRPIKDEPKKDGEE